jgi:hypothetical protein
MKTQKPPKFNIKITWVENGKAMEVSSYTNDIKELQNILKNIIK